MFFCFWFRSNRLQHFIAYLFVLLIMHKNRFKTTTSCMQRARNLLITASKMFLANLWTSSRMLSLNRIADIWMIALNKHFRITSKEVMPDGSVDPALVLAQRRRNRTQILTGLGVFCNTIGRRRSV
jgi:hypothetical protein